MSDTDQPPMSKSVVKRLQAQGAEPVATQRELCLEQGANGLQCDLEKGHLRFPSEGGQNFASRHNFALSLDVSAPEAGGEPELRTRMTKLSRPAYERLVSEDLEWLLKQPRTLERDHVEVIVRQSPDREYRVSQPAGEPSDSITFDALLTVLRRLRSKNRNPERQWYLGWNAALDCLINDAKARRSAPSTTPTDEEVARKIYEDARDLVECRPSHQQNVEPDCFTCEDLEEKAIIKAFAAALSSTPSEQKENNDA